MAADDPEVTEARLDRSVDRYLDVLAGALLDEYHLENEVRLVHLVRAMENDAPPDPAMLRDPARYLQNETMAAQAIRRSGAVRPADDPWSLLPYSVMGRHRMGHLRSCLEALRDEGIVGDLVEVGTGRGGGAIFMRGWLEVREDRDRTVWVADRFRADGGSESPSGPPGSALLAVRPDLNSVREGFARFGLLDEQVRFLQGEPADTLPPAPIERVALLRVHGDAADVEVGLRSMHDRLVPGGFVIVDGGAAAVAAGEAYRAGLGVEADLVRVDDAAVAWRAGPGPAPATAPSRERDERVTARHRSPLAPPAPEPSLDLSVVVVFYEMKREAARTLRSLSRAYQRGVDDTTYEVIVVENGSSAEQRLGAEYVRSFGPEFRYVDMGEEATSTPVGALNRGIAEARGEVLALMIDGAHVVTPQVLRYGLLGLATYRPAIVATQQWYIGPGQQGDTMNAGYDEAYEDRLFEQIEWPVDGYRLFEIGHFIGDRDWFDGMWESNCIFVERSLLGQVGGFDEAFAMPGGGYANLDLYERLGSTPDLTVVSVLGEGSFHQTHGGTTTNQAADERRNRVFSYGQSYQELRGRPFRGPGKPIHYVGAMLGPARRTRARRMGAGAFLAAAAGVDGRGEHPVPMPEELVLSFIEAFWHSHAWRQTRWLGTKVRRPPTDLIAYQELLHRIRPDWVVETGTGDGGRTAFLASMLDLVGHGQVVSLDPNPLEGRPLHPRIHYVLGNARDAGAVAEVRELVGDGRAFVVLGSHMSRRRTYEEFLAFADLVPRHSYVIVENTIVNGRPVWPGFGNGPGEAVKQILANHGDFVADPDMERWGLTFNPGGYLRRTR